uniref:Adenylyl cyclase-associated protein n=1 Tax=Scophthalmus maximus TaxID=52904 RepID=A0A8D3A7L0_SCOMX
MKTIEVAEFVTMEGLMQRLERAVTRLEHTSVTLQASSGMTNGDCVNGIDGGKSAVEAFDQLLRGPVSDYLNKSRAIGREVEKHAEMVNDALQTQRRFLEMAATHQQPAKVHDLLKPISDHIQAIQSFRERNRGSGLFNHLSAVSESIPALGWVAVCQKPGPYVKEMNDAATFYTNRVLKDYKESDRRHVDWVRSYLSIWTEMQTFIKQHHTTGLEWSKSGPIAPPSLFDSPKTPSAPCPPPPPPPGPPPVFTDEDSQPQVGSATAQHSALFAQLNQGMDITRGLKHVSDDKKSHKNPNLRSQAAPTKTKSSGSGNSSRATVQKRPPLLELEGKKWRVENFEQKHDLLIEETELKQVAYVFGCNNSTLQIKGKINSIIIDNCKKLGLVFENAVGIVEIINSKAIQLQVLGTVPTISINKTEGCQVYLSKDSLNCDIVSAKSSEMNILIPQGDDDYREFPVPEQFKTVWDGSKLVTEPTEMAG